MKRMFVIGVACLALLVAAPVASAAGPPAQAPQMQSVSCSVSTAGGTYSWSFRLPSYATTWFQQALARAQQYFPGLSCSFS
jgi:hypothetical protein